MCTSLGAHFNSRSIFVNNLSTNEKSFTLHYPEPVIKLIHNTFDTKSILKNSNKKFMERKYIVKVYEKK